MLTANIPPGASARAAARANSTVVRWAGVRAATNTSATTTSNDGRDLLQHRPGIGHPDLDSPGAGAALVQRQPATDQPDHLGVGLHGDLAGAGPGRRHVPGQRQAAAAQVQHPQRRPGRGGQVQQVAQPPHVLQLQVPRIVQVDVGLRDAAGQQHPGPGAVRVGQQLEGGRFRVIRHDHHCPPRRTARLPGRPGTGQRAPRSARGARC